MPALIAGALAIGTSPILVRLSELPPTATAFWRVALAVPVLYLLSVRFGGSSMGGGAEARMSVVSSRADRWGLAVAGFFLAVDLACLHWSLRYTSVTNAILFLNFAPFFVAFASWGLYREPIGLRFVLGLLVTIGGMTALMGAYGVLNPSLNSSQFVGDGFGLLAGAFYGGYLMVVARYRCRISTLTVMAVSSAACAVTLFPVAYLMGERLIPVTGSGVGVLIGLAVITHAGGQGLIAYALRSLPTPVAAVTLMLQPIAAGLGAWLVFAEALSPWQLVGAVVVMVGIVIVRTGT